MARSTFKNYAKRQGRRFTKWTKKRYGTWTKPNIVNVVKDVRLLKSLINVEKKYKVVPYTDQIFALNSGTGRGDWCDSLIDISQGTTNSTRVGNSVKLTSMQYSLTISKESNVSEAIAYNLYFVQRMSQPNSITTGFDSTLVPRFLNVDQSGFYSTRSLRDIENFGSFRVLRKCSGNLYADASDTSGTVRHDCKGYFKLNSHIRWSDEDGITQNQIYIIAVANDGDIGTASGCTFSGEIRYFYVDN